MNTSRDIVPNLEAGVVGGKLNVSSWLMPMLQLQRAIRSAGEFYFGRPIRECGGGSIIGRKIALFFLFPGRWKSEGSDRCEMNGAGNELATYFLLVLLGSSAVKKERNPAGRTKRNFVLCSLIMRGTILNQSSGVSAEQRILNLRNERQNFTAWHRSKYSSKPKSW